MKQGIKLVQGVGINDADYKTRVYENVGGRLKCTWTCPYYRRWSNMLKRCYSVKLHETQPTYKGCTVCEEWLVFSRFKQWMENQDWEGNELDKDILHVGNKEYHPDSCVFVKTVVNRFTLDSNKIRGQYPTGVYFKKDHKRFEAQCRNPLTGNNERLGYFDNAEDAHIAWKMRKYELACQLADSDYVDDERVAEALRTRYL